MKNYKKLVSQTLLENISARDDDQYLYSVVLSKLGFKVEEELSLLLIAKVTAKTLPSLDTITRLRRMVQMTTPSLRGTLWDERHGKKVEKALSDLGYTNVYYDGTGHHPC